jgi:hypothetical protein
MMVLSSSVYTKPMSFLVLLVVICCSCGGFFQTVTAANETSSSGHHKESKNETDYYPNSNLTFSPTPFGMYDNYYNTTNATATNTTITWSPSPTPFNGTAVVPYPTTSIMSTNSSNTGNSTSSNTTVTNTTNVTDTSSSIYSNETLGVESNSSSPLEYDRNETTTANETISTSYNETINSTNSSEPWDLYNTSDTSNATMVPTPAVTSDQTQQGDTKETNATFSPSPTNSPSAATIVPYPKFDGHQFEPETNDDTQGEEEEVTFTAYDYDTDDTDTSESNNMIYSSSSTADDDIQQSNVTSTVAIVLACMLLAALTAWEIQRNPQGFCANLTYCVASVIWYLVSTPILFLWRFALNRATRRSTYHDADYFQESSFQPASRRGDQDLRYQPRNSRYIPRDLELS